MIPLLISLETIFYDKLFLNVNYSVDYYAKLPNYLR